MFLNFLDDSIKIKKIKKKNKKILENPRKFKNLPIFLEFSRK